MRTMSGLRPSTALRVGGDRVGHQGRARWPSIFCSPPERWGDPCLPDCGERREERRMLLLGPARLRRWSGGTGIACSRSRSGSREDCCRSSLHGTDPAGRSPPAVGRRRRVRTIRLAAARERRLQGSRGLAQRGRLAHALRPRSATSSPRAMRSRTFVQDMRESVSRR